MTILSAQNLDRLWTSLAVAILLFASIVNLQGIRYHWTTGWASRGHRYSYVEHDFPPSLIPLDEHPYNSRLTIEDTVYYDVNATAEWHSLFPSGGGFVRLGPDYRLFGVSMFHQLHCLDKMRRAVLEEPPTEWEKWHTQHCLNYVRQMILCESNLRLEQVKDSPVGLKADGLGLEHTCRDWSILYDIAEENSKHWPEGLYP